MDTDFKEFGEECPEGMIELKTEFGVYRVFHGHEDILTEIQRPMKKYKMPKITTKFCGCARPLIQGWDRRPTLNDDYEFTMCVQCKGRCIVPKK